MVFKKEIVIVVIKMLHGKKKVPVKGLHIYILYITCPLTFGKKSKSRNRCMRLFYSLLRDKCRVIFELSKPVGSNS
jgi:hypothetical protein